MIITRRLFLQGVAACGITIAVAEKAIAEVLPSPAEIPPPVKTSTIMSIYSLIIVPLEGNTEYSGTFGIRRRNNNQLIWGSKLNICEGSLLRWEAPLGSRASIFVTQQYPVNLEADFVGLIHVGGRIYKTAEFLEEDLDYQETFQRTFCLSPNNEQIRLEP